MRFLILVFIIIPILEMWLLIKVGGVIGALPTIVLVFLTAMIGLALLRQQSFSTLLRAQSRMSHGELPASELVEGIFLAAGGALLLTPGFVTDAIGFACLLPGIRQVLIAWGIKQFRLRKMNISSHHAAGFNARPSAEAPPVNEKTHVIEGECRREDK